MNDRTPPTARQATYINLPPDKVYDAITSHDSWNAFFTTGMEIDPQPGGACIWRWKDWGPDKYSVEVDGKVLEADRPRKFVFQWGSNMSSIVSFRLEPRDDGTIIRLEETGYPETPDGLAMLLECAAGWGEALTLLKFYLEHGVTYTGPGKD